MSQYPCLNPQCKSHGTPHPNCRCYGPNAMAGGGEVSYFCSGGRAHDSGCEYYSDGGEVLPSFDEMVGQKNLPSFDEMVKSSGPEKIPSFDEMVASQPGDGGWMEQAKAGAEGLTQGILGPLAPMAEVGLGISTKEAISKRAEDFPMTHGTAEAAGFVGSLFTPASPFGVVGKGAAAAAKAAGFGKIGSAVIKGAVESASFTASDEMTKAFLGVPGSDPETPVSAALLHVGAAGLMGGAGGGVFSLGEGMIGKGLESITNEKTQKAVENFLAKVGESKDPLSMLGVTKKISGAAAKTIAAPIALKTGSGYLGYEAIQSAINPYIKKMVGKANPYVTDAAIKAMLTNEVSGLPNAIHYAAKAARGVKMANDGVDALFKIGSGTIAPQASESFVEELRKFIEDGQVDQQLLNTSQQEPQGFAKGGQVKSEPSEPFARIFPEQNTVLNMAKGRISNYLNAIRPTKNQPKPAFDNEPKNGEKIRQYNKALGLAVNPMSILDHVNKGSLTPEHMQHFTALYPEVYRFLSKKMTKRIIDAQIKKEKPPYGKRQSMSLFLGADLDSSFSPVAIQTIQGLYANSRSAQAQQVVTKNKKGNNAMSKTVSSYQTDEQSRERRMQNAKS